MLDKMLLSDWISLITALGVIVAMVATVYNMVKNGKKEAGRISGPSPKCGRISSISAKKWIGLKMSRNV